MDLFGRMKKRERRRRKRRETKNKGRIVEVVEKDGVSIYSLPFLLCTKLYRVQSTEYLSTNTILYPPMYETSKLYKMI